MKTSTIVLKMQCVPQVHSAMRYTMGKMIGEENGEAIFKDFYYTSDYYTN